MSNYVVVTENMATVGFMEALPAWPCEQELCPLTSVVFWAEPSPFPSYLDGSQPHKM